MSILKLQEDVILNSCDQLDARIKLMLVLLGSPYTEADCT